MKFKRPKMSTLILICIVLLFASATLAKYVVELSIDDTITAERFYFRSNVLQSNDGINPLQPDDDMAELTPVTVNGKTTIFTVSNGAGTLAFSDQDITWELQYYVDAGDGFVPVLQEPEVHTLTRGLTMTTETLTVSPVVYNGEEYCDVIVEAKSTAPYEKVLRVRLQFNYTQHTISYSYSKSMGVVTATITTNDDAGVYHLNWLYPFIPDNADPNGILTSAKAPDEDDVDGNSLDANLESYTTYRLHFFIDSDVRSFVDQAVNGATDAEIEALILQYLSISYE